MGKPLSAQSLMSHGGRLGDNTESGAGDRGLAVTFHRGVREVLRCSIETLQIFELIICGGEAFALMDLPMRFSWS